MLSVQFPIPPLTNISISSHHIKSKALSPSTHYSTGQTRVRYGPNGNFAYSCNPNSPPPEKLRFAGKPKCAASGIENENNQIELPAGGLDPKLMPKHVALFFDGNRRWAKSKGLTSLDGYKAGTENLTELILHFKKYGVQILSVFAWSSGNWVRPQEEIQFLIELYEETMQTYFEELMRNDVRVIVMGDRSRFPQCLQDLIYSLEARTKNNKRLHLVVATNYSGRYDITQATTEIARKVKDGVLRVEDVNETILAQHLETNGVEFPDPDLLIRTGNKFKVSNFMLWQLAYTQLYFSNKMFPEFNEQDALQALAAFQQNKRRFPTAGY